MDTVFTNNIKFKGEPCIKMSVGRYTCVIAPRIGGNCIRLFDNENQMELVNFDKKIPMKWIRYPSILCGMPSMLFPNRLEDGVLRTSDSVYHFPINEEQLHNFIHGFIHTKHFNIVSCGANNEKRLAKTVLEYNYGENDNEFSFFPVNFTARIIYTLTDEGLTYSFKISNTSDKMLPVGVGNHTSMRAPFVKRGKKKNIRIQIPALRRVELNERYLPTGNLLELSESDKKYITGEAIPVLTDIDNHMFEIGTVKTPLGKDIHGIVLRDVKKKKSIIYELSDAYKFLILWNCGGESQFFCPEPMSWLISAPNLDLPHEISGYKEIAPGETFECWQKLSSEIYN